MILARSRLFAVLPIATFAAWAALATAQTPPGPSARGDRTPTVKQQNAKPLTGTRATGDEDETNDLEVQRRTRTMEGRSAFKSSPKVQDVAPETPRGGDTAYRDPGRFSQGRPSGALPQPIVNPNAPVESGTGNAIPVHK